MKNIHNAVAVLSVAAMTTLSSPGAATASGPTIKSGQSYEFQFDGNPSTGYKWQLNEAASSGLDIVRIEVLGYDRPLSKLIGAPAPFVFRLTCMAEGFVELQFDYVSPGSEKTVANSHTHWARCE
jgi:inhibitor of cysteine peptidase